MKVIITADKQDCWSCVDTFKREVTHWLEKRSMRLKSSNVKHSTATTGNDDRISPSAPRRASNSIPSTSSFSMEISFLDPLFSNTASRLLTGTFTCILSVINPPPFGSALTLVVKEPKFDWTFIFRVIVPDV